MSDKKTKYVMQLFVPVGELGILYCAEADFQPVVVPLCVQSNDPKLIGMAQALPIGATVKFYIVCAYQAYHEENPLTLKPTEKHKCIGQIEIYGTLVARKVVAPAWWSDREIIPERDKA